MSFASKTFLKVDTFSKNGHFLNNKNHLCELVHGTASAEKFGGKGVPQFLKKIGRGYTHFCSRKINISSMPNPSNASFKFEMLTTKYKFFACSDGIKIIFHVLLEI